MKGAQFRGPGVGLRFATGQFLCSSLLKKVLPNNTRGTRIEEKKVELHIVMRPDTGKQQLLFKL